MSLDAGRNLAHYEILEPIGKGGMGEVYRARDGKLGRDVAIKVLPDEFARDEERLRRFQREAKVLAALNHPNIASIYGLEVSDDTHYLVLELVPGETLAERIARGAIPLERALDIAGKIAEALEAAHEQGIVHRDLKPANVKLTEDRQIKVLDFGLAKALAEDAPDADSSMSPTITRDATRVGVILGTAAYMSPEQAKGKRVDKRADVWAFGAVLYEMLTGDKAFAGEDVSDTLAYVLTQEPNWDALPASAPPALARTLKLCLTKDVKRRLRDIGDVSLALEGAFGASDVETPPPSPPSARSVVLVGLAGLVLGGLVVGAMGRNLARPTPTPVARFSINQTSRLLSTYGPPLIAIAPDGRTIVYTARDQLYRRELGELESRPIPDTDAANSPFFSPDGEWVGFQAGDRGQLKKVSLSGGPSVPLADTSVAGASWGSDGTILFGVDASGLARVSAEGGEPRAVTTLEDGESGHYRPDLLPNGAALFTIWSTGLETAQIAVVSFDTGERRILTGGTYPRYVPTGHIVFAREASLWAAPFDLDELELTGSPVPILDGVSVSLEGGAAQFAIAENGSLLYVASDAVDRRTLVWVDRSGNEEPLAAEPRRYIYPRVSPDGTRIALDVFEGSERDVWIWNVARVTATRFTFDPARDYHPVWTRDGARIAFGSNRDRAGSLYWKAADGTGEAEPLTESEHYQLPQAFLPNDNQSLIYLERRRFWDLGILSAAGGEEPLLASEFSEQSAALSPDGRWVAYHSDASGQNEVYVRPFPNVDDGIWQISTDRGTHPQWSPDGTELYYLSTEINAFTTAVMAVPIETEPSFVPGNPELAFQGNYVGETIHRPYDVAPDGRLLMIQRASDSAAELILVQNWFQEIERLVPSH